jgi:hypothetical protein
LRQNNIVARLYNIIALNYKLLLELPAMRNIIAYAQYSCPIEQDYCVGAQENDPHTIYGPKIYPPYDL